MEAQPNSGFTPSGTGWVRLKLKNDDPVGSWRDLYAVHGRFYPLAVAQYEIAFEGHEELVFESGQALGGYTRSQGLDEAPYTNLPPNVGLYACHETGGLAGIRSAQDSEVQQLLFAPGGFYAQDIRDVALAEGSGLGYFLLVMP